MIRENAVPRPSKTNSISGTTDTQRNDVIMTSAQPSLHRTYDPASKLIQQALERATATNSDPEVIESLKTAILYSDMRDDYAMQCTSEESDTCRRIRQATLAHPWAELKEQGKTIWLLTPKMLSGPLEGQLLKSLVSGQKARRVLDVGMYTGYSAMSMAEALPAGGQVITLDLDPYLQHFNQPFFDSSPHGAKISIRIGRAVDTMKELVKEGLQFDVIFLDADKSEYIDYLKLAFDEGLLAENGTVAVDNAFRFGNNYLPSDSPPDASRLFGSHVSNDPRLHKVLVPIRDGVLLVRRLSEVERDSAQ